MNFGTNLKILMKELNITNNELAYFSNLDPTIISKFRNGIRVPVQNSQTLNALILGINNLIIQKDKNNQSKIIFGNTNDLLKSITTFLITNSNDIRLQKENNIIIGENLEYLMNKLKITNISLAKYLNKDVSLISKYKKGKRFILRNDIIVNKICNYFNEYIKKNNLNYIFYSLENINKTLNLKDNIMSYLFTQFENKSAISTFLNSLNNFKMNISNIPTYDTLVQENILNDNENIYIGVEEFRNSVKRFLGSVCKSEKPTTLYLYSDENMDWMTNDKEFYNTWKLLMINTLFKKNKIKIVHNINRNQNEIFEAIDSWLPLYMSGLIEPYYCIKNRNNLFSHTLFIADNISLINSFTITNKKNNNIYNYYENEKILINYKEQFLKLIENSERLLKIYINDDIERKIIKKELFNIYSLNNLENISIFIKKDESIIYVLKNDLPKALFEFLNPKTITYFKEYVSKKINN